MNPELTPGKPAETSRPGFFRNALALLPARPQPVLPWRTLAAGVGLLLLQGLGPEEKLQLAANPLTAQVFYGDLPGFLRDLAAFLLLGAVIERQLGPRFWFAAGAAFLGTGLALQALFPAFSAAGLSGVLNALLFIALWEAWRRRGGVLLPALMFAGSLGVAVIALLGGLTCAAPLLAPYMQGFVPALGYAAGALWAVWHGCRDMVLELRSLSRFSGKMY